MPRDAVSWTVNVGTVGKNGLNNLPADRRSYSILSLEINMTDPDHGWKLIPPALTSCQEFPGTNVGNITRNQFPGLHFQSLNKRNIPVQPLNVERCSFIYFDVETSGLRQNFTFLSFMLPKKSAIKKRYGRARPCRVGSIWVVLFECRRGDPYMTANRNFVRFAHS